MAKGLLYFAQNSAFQHLTKIGITTKLDVEDRGLSGSNVPEDFDYLAVFECDDIKWAEDKLHAQFQKFRHYTATNRKTEFFWSGCVKEAIKYAKDLKGVYDKTESETEVVEKVTDSGEVRLERTPQTTFEMIGLPKGSQIFFKNDKKFSAITLDNKNQVEYNGKKYSVSPLALKLYNESINQNQKTLNGYRYFYYNGVSLWDLRPDQKEKH